MHLLICIWYFHVHEVRDQEFLDHDIKKDILWKMSGSYLTRQSQIPALFKKQLIVTGKDFATIISTLPSSSPGIKSQQYKFSVFSYLNLLRPAQISIFSFSISITLTILFLHNSYFGICYLDFSLLLAYNKNNSQHWVYLVPGTVLDTS